MEKLEALKKQYEKAVLRLDEVTRLAKNDITRDSSVKRFEIVMDLSWKLLKTFLEEKKGIICRSPKDCFREAFRLRLIDHDPVWLDFIDLRNESAHTYKEEIADMIYARLPEVLSRVQFLLKTVFKP